MDSETCIKKEDRINSWNFIMTESKSETKVIFKQYLGFESLDRTLVIAEVHNSDKGCDIIYFKQIARNYESVFP